MLKNQLNLYHLQIEELLKVIKELYNVEYDYKKHNLNLFLDHKLIGYIRLPLSVHINNFLEHTSIETCVLYLTIEAGNAALCLVYDNDILYHKTFSAYMTRKKQGMSQIKYLNKKGKSRAGSRVRLASTIEFFEQINMKLNEVYVKYTIDRVAISCTPTLLPYFYDSKVIPPFEKKDEMIYKIPLHIPQSNYSNLLATIKKLKAPVLFYQEGIDLSIFQPE